MQRFSTTACRQRAACEVRDWGVPSVARGAATRPRAQRDAEPPRRVTRRSAFTDSERTPTLAAANAQPARALAMSPSAFTDTARTRTPAAIDAQLAVAPCGHEHAPEG